MHCLFLDGIYLTQGDQDGSGWEVFRQVNAPTKADLEALLHTISTRLASFLVKEGLLVQESENAYLNLEHLEENPMQQVHGHSITYRIAIGPQQGRKVFTHVIFSPLDFMAKLAALVPKPRVNLTRFHGIFAPNSKHRMTITPAKRGKGSRKQTIAEADDRTPMEKHAAVPRSSRLPR